MYAQYPTTPDGDSLSKYDLCKSFALTRPPRFVEGTHMFESGFEELATEREKLEEEAADDPVNIAEAEERFEIREERKEKRQQRDRRWLEALKRLIGRGQRSTQE